MMSSQLPGSFALNQAMGLCPSKRGSKRAKSMAGDEVDKTDDKVKSVLVKTEQQHRNNERSPEELLKCSINGESPTQQTGENVIFARSETTCMIRYRWWSNRLLIVASLVAAPSLYPRHMSHAPQRAPDFGTSSYRPTAGLHGTWYMVHGMWYVVG